MVDIAGTKQSETKNTRTPLTNQTTSGARNLIFFDSECVYFNILPGRIDSVDNQST